MKYTTKLVSAIVLIFSALVFNVSADSVDHQKIIQIDQDLTYWKIKGPAFLSKWEVGKAHMNPSNPKTLIANGDGNLMLLYLRPHVLRTKNGSPRQNLLKLCSMGR